MKKTHEKLGYKGNADEWRTKTVCLARNPGIILDNKLWGPFGD